MKIQDLIQSGASILKDIGIESFVLDCQLLLAHALGADKQYIILNPNEDVCSEDYAKFQKLIERRANREPLQYIIQKCEFFGMDFYVDENVLVPRPDTEILVEASIKYINENNVKTVLDICSGSGAIGISIARYCPHVKVTALDISRKALDIARINSKRNNVCIDYIESDMFKNVKKTFDIIVSNPPYISQIEMDELPKNVADYEPHMALYGGKDGLSFYKILAESGNYLNSYGKIFIEIGANQKNDIIDIFKKENFILHSALKDLAGLDRTLIFGKNI